MKASTTPTGTYAIVRGVADTYDECVRTYERSVNIDVELARRQHDAYCGALESAKLKVIRIPADNSLPDCVFVEDPAIVYKGKAIICRMGVKSRAGETEEVRNVMSRHLKTIADIKPPATIEGGDVLKVEDDLFVGLTARTDVDGISQLRDILRSEECSVTPIEVRNILHLKSACSYIGNRCIVASPGYIDLHVFSRFNLIRLPKEEAYAANCLAINGIVFVIKGYPKTKKMIEKHGFATEEIDVSEFKKGEGSLTCLSIIF